MNPTILSPNTSGQGYCDAHRFSGYHPLAMQYGYLYSHSTPITHMNGVTRILHTYRAGDHTLSFGDHPSTRWHTSTAPASGRQHSGDTYEELARHLANKARRHRSLRAKQAAARPPLASVS